MVNDDTEMPSSSAAANHSGPESPSSSAIYDVVDEETAREVQEVAVETSKIRAIGFGAVPALFAGLILAAFSLGLQPGPLKPLVFGLVLTMIGTLAAVPALGRRYRDRLLRERGIDREVANQITKAIGLRRWMPKTLRQIEASRGRPEGASDAKG